MAGSTCGLSGSMEILIRSTRTCWTLWKGGLSRLDVYVHLFVQMQTQTCVYAELLHDKKEGACRRG